MDWTLNLHQTPLRGNENGIKQHTPTSFLTIQVTSFSFSSAGIEEGSMGCNAEFDGMVHWFTGPGRVR